MKIFGKFSFALVLLAVGLSLSTSRAAAQSVAVGTFTLPEETHWGLAVLPAGDYSFSVEVHGSGPVVAVRQTSGKGVGLFFSHSATQIAETGSASLILTRAGNEMYVSTFKLGTVGLALDFNLPKAAEALTANQPSHPPTAMLAAASR